MLIADDEAIARRVLAHAVKQADHASTVVPSGEEAWRALSGAAGPPVAVLDWMMPGLTGIEVCEKARAAGLRPAPYLMCSPRGASRTTWCAPSRRRWPTWICAWCRQVRSDGDLVREVTGKD